MVVPGLHGLSTGMFLFLLQMEWLKEELEGTEKEMASGSCSLPAASLPDTAGNIHHHHPSTTSNETSQQLLCSQGVLASHHLHQEWTLPLLPSGSGGFVQLNWFHGPRLQRRFSSSCTTVKTTLDQGRTHILKATLHLVLSPQQAPLFPCVSSPHVPLAEGFHGSVFYRL